MILKPLLFQGIFNLAYLPQDIDFAVILEEILLFWVHLRQSAKSLRQWSEQNGRFLNWSFISDFVLKNNENVIDT